jgi:hypothetical protein
MASNLTTAAILAGIQDLDRFAGDRRRFSDRKVGKDPVRYVFDDHMNGAELEREALAANKVLENRVAQIKKGGNGVGKSGTETMRTGKRKAPVTKTQPASKRAKYTDASDSAGVGQGKVAKVAKSASSNPAIKRTKTSAKDAMGSHDEDPAMKTRQKKTVEPAKPGSRTQRDRKVRAAPMLALEGSTPKSNTKQNGSLEAAQTDREARIAILSSQRSVQGQPKSVIQQYNEIMASQEPGSEAATSRTIEEQNDTSEPAQIDHEQQPDVLESRPPVDGEPEFRHQQDKEITAAQNLWPEAVAQKLSDEQNSNSQSEKIDHRQQLAIVESSEPVHVQLSLEESDNLPHDNTLASQAILNTAALNTPLHDDEPINAPMDDTENMNAAIDRDSVVGTTTSKLMGAASHTSEDPRNSDSATATVGRDDSDAPHDQDTDVNGAKILELVSTASTNNGLAVRMEDDAVQGERSTRFQDMSDMRPLTPDTTRDEPKGSAGPGSTPNTPAVKDAEHLPIVLRLPGPRLQAIQSSRSKDNSKLTWKVPTFCKEKLSLEAPVDYSWASELTEFGLSCDEYDEAAPMPPAKKRRLNAPKPAPEQSPKNTARDKKKPKAISASTNIDDASTESLLRGNGVTAPSQSKKGLPSTPRSASSGSRRRMKPTNAPLVSPYFAQANTANTSLLARVNPDLLQLSRSMTRRQPLDEKPQPIGQPEVWAATRQGLCETVPYFKKPQGGCHSNDKHVYSFLFDGVGHCREYMDQNLIIARAGGGMESDGTSMSQSKDQSMTDSQVLSVMNDMQLQNPLIVICGNRNEGAVVRMPHKYCVLGWFKPTMVWAEKTAGRGKKDYVTIKYRLERLGQQNETQPWHAPSVAAIPDRSKAGDVATNTCSTCLQRCPQIYLESWLCLNAQCAAFWRLDSGNLAPTGRLEYHPAFLLHNTRWETEEAPFSVRPPLPDVGNAIGDNITYINTRGVVCPQCGRCNQRYKWEGWQCDNPMCTWEGLRPRHQPLVPAALHSPWDTIGKGPTLARNKHEAGVRVSVQYTHGYKVYEYTFDKLDGRFIHAVANKRVNQETCGPDDMFADLQKAELGLERRRFGADKLSVPQDANTPKTPQRPLPSVEQLPTPPAEERAERDVLSPAITAIADDAAVGDHATTDKALIEDGDFMTAFSMNYGMPYKFVASGTSRSFDDPRTPEAVRECRRRLNWAGRNFIADPQVDVDFNEELVFAYMQGQKIEYHDDGEEGLGPRIATLSLGGRAKMHLRMKMKHYNGCSKTGLLTADRPIPGCLEYERRSQIWQELEPMKDTDRAAYQRRIKEIPKELGLYEKRNGKAGDLVTVTLNHGDIILMDGYDIQKFLEHKVVPEDNLRFALTCRTVLEHHLKEHERPGYDVKPDEQVYEPSIAR